MEGTSPGGRRLRPRAWLCCVRLSSCLRAWRPGPVEASWVAGPSPFPQALAHWTCTVTWEEHREPGLPGFLLVVPAGLCPPWRGSKCPTVNVGIDAHLDPSNCRLVVDRGYNGTVFPH